MTRVARALLKLFRNNLFHFYKIKFKKSKNLKINLGSGYQKVPGFISVDIAKEVDVCLDLGRGELPFQTASVDIAVCTSMINYISYDQAAKLIKEIYRILRVGGVCRMSVQDLDLLIKYYYEKDNFFYQKLSDGRDRFLGRTIADKFNNWFFGFESNGSPCRYVYNFESLKLLFLDAGFMLVERKNFLESSIDNIALIDNRSDQMFFLEAIKT